MDYFLGEIVLFAIGYAPEQFLPCDGQALAKSNYQALYAVLGGTYGQNNTSFNLPDLRGRVFIGDGQGPNLSPRAIGQQLGTPTVTLTLPDLPRHQHSFQGSTAIGTSGVVSGNILSTTPSEFDPYHDNRKPSIASASMAVGVIGIAGLPQPAAHQNMMPTLGLMYCICVNGIFPTPP